MERQIIRLPEYGWHVIVYYDVVPKDASEVTDGLQYFGCPAKGVVKAANQLYSGLYNSGLTYSNRRCGKSLMVLGRATSFPQFLNTFVHEVHHLATHIALAIGMDLKGEEVCYLSGGVAQQMFPVLKHYISYCLD